MAFMIKEYLDSKCSFASPIGEYDGKIDFKEASSTSLSDTIDPNSLMVEIEGIHAAPFATRNYTRYTPKCLKNSIPTWTNPYYRPLIKHHNEESGDIIGRIIEATYVNKNTLSGTPAIKFTVNVPDEKAKQDISNGLLSTTSIGVIAHDVKCSICGKPVIDAITGCEEGHQRGVTYETDRGQEICYWDIDEMEAKELSFVVVPSDMYSQKINFYSASKSSNNPTQIKEKLDLNNTSHQKGEQNMEDNKQQQVELDEAKAKVAGLEAEIAQLKEAAKTYEAKVADLEAENVKLKESNEAFEKELKDLKESNGNLETQISEDKQLREGLEQEIASVKAQFKEAVVETFVTMKEALGNKVTDIENVKNRTMDSLKDSISDMKESLASKKEAKELPRKNSIEDPTLKNDGIEAKESVQSIDLKAGLKSIFNYGITAQQK